MAVIPLQFLIIPTAATTLRIAMILLAHMAMMLAAVTAVMLAVMEATLVEQMEAGEATVEVEVVVEEVDAGAARPLCK